MGWFTGLIGFLNNLMAYIRENKLIQTGEDLQKGAQDAKTLSDIKKINDAVSNTDPKSVDDELRID